MNNTIKAPVKTTKSQFDIQVDLAEKELKHKKGVSFVRIHGNTVEYITVTNVPEQTFRFFYNPSKLTASERKQMREKGKLVESLLSANTLKNEEDDL